MADGVKFKIDVLFGHVQLRAWLEFDGEKFIGMGSKQTIDDKGNTVGYEQGPTGLEFKFA